MFLPQTIFNRVHHLGISINPYAVRAVVVDSSGKVINKAEIITTETLINGEDVNIPRLTEALRNLSSKIGINHAYAACCFPEKLAYSREHILPIHHDSEITEAIGWQLGTIFPFDPEELYWDWKLIDQTGKDSRIVITAVNKRLIDGLVSSFNAAGIKPVSFESSASALARSLKEIPDNAIIIEIDNFGSSTTLVEKGVSSLTATTNFSASADGQSVISEIVTTINQLQKRISPSDPSKSPTPIYATGEKAVPEIITAISTELDQPISQLATDQTPNAFQSAYLESISTIDAPESNKSINLLPHILEQYYQTETDIAQAKTAAAYGIGASLLSFLLSLGLFIASTMLLSASANQLAAVPEPPLPPANHNLGMFLQKSQQIARLQSTEYIPKLQLDTLLSVIDTSLLRQLSYDAAKKTIKIVIAPLDRNQLIDIKSSLDSTALFSPISVPLSALNSEKAESIALTLQIIEPIKP